MKTTSSHFPERYESGLEEFLVEATETSEVLPCKNGGFIARLCSEMIEPERLMPSSTLLFEEFTALSPEFESTFLLDFFFFGT